ncbi:DUF4235 domain-containing protein [Rhodococcus phenolicus]|uniref:DUF4235 domain-containing protein n=1 Tax=Rhodococcus phenolicus TaxID=263849 RepID=UPI000835CDD9|nr:DUF4235 domain-containing protein [Rhodococcus phenolicus]
MTNPARKILYKTLSTATGVLGGVLAGLAFRQVWMRLGDGDTPPDPKDLSQSNREVLFAAALQGAVFAVVKAAVDRAGERSFRTLAR